MDPIIVPIDGILDLHTFAPDELKELMADYIGACLEAGIHDLRIIHGKGSGVMRARVRSIVAKDPRVQAFGDAGTDGGGWGATLVTLKRESILVVDNESDQLAMMKRILARIGYEAKTADNPHDALKMVKEEAFGMVLVDLIMPEIDGTELCEQIKQICPAVRVFAFSGHTHLYTPEQLERAGFTGTIDKPASIEAIRVALTIASNNNRGHGDGSNADGARPNRQHQSHPYTPAK